MTILLPLLLMAGTVTDPGNPAPVRVAPLPIPHRGSNVRRQGNANLPPAPVARDRLGTCLEAVKADPMTGLAVAKAWVADAQGGGESGRANECLATAQVRSNQFSESLPAFGRAIAAVPAGQEGRHAALYALGAQAALAVGDSHKALAWLDTALLPSSVLDAEARANALCDRARALVALGRPADARTALAEAHRDAPDNGEAWLLSATLARREKDLATAQHDIEQAAQFAPKDAAVGLEAGVIAVLSGRDEAARKSWQSVLASAPDSPEASTARGYLAQLGVKVPDKTPATRQVSGR